MLPHYFLSKEFCMNIARMCMIVEMSWLLVAQDGAHAMEQDNVHKEGQNHFGKGFSRRVLHATKMI
jgi:hypothetical protein